MGRMVRCGQGCGATDPAAEVTGDEWRRACREAVLMLGLPTVVAG